MGELGTPGLVIQTEREAGGVVLALYGELDLATAPQLERHLRGTKAIGGRVTVDLSGLGFMDSSGLHVLLDAQQRCRQDGCQLYLLRGTSHVHRLFELTSTVETFSFED